MTHWKNTGETFETSKHQSLLLRKTDITWTNIEWLNVTWTNVARTGNYWPNPYRIWIILNNKCCQDFINNSLHMAIWTNVTGETWVKHWLNTSETLVKRLLKP